MENGHAASAPSPAAKRPKSDLVRAIVLDIEGTIAPLTFVSEVLFPYARDHVRAHLEATYDSEETQRDVHAIRDMIAADLASTSATKEGLSAIPAPAAGNRAAVIDAVVSNVHALIKQDRKAGPLKDLQGHVWRTGFEQGALKGQLFDDVVPALQSW